MLSAFNEHFSTIPDARQQSKVEHKLHDILLTLVVSVICGADGWEAIEEVAHHKVILLKKYGSFENGIPVHDTIARVTSAIAPDKLQQCFISWMKAAHIATKGEVIAIDGKTVRGSYDKKSKKNAIHMVSAFAANNGVVLGQIKIAEKSNEITAIPQLLDLLDIKDSIVTIDAIGRQRAIATKIKEKEADYVIAVKGNQGHLHQSIKDFFEIFHEKEFSKVSHQYHEEIDSGHGRVESRKYWISETLSIKDLTLKWSGLISIGMAESERHINGKTRKEVRDFICSIKANAKIFAQAVRKHWSIENQLHWVLDISFNEDLSRVRRGNVAENMSVLRHLVLNLLREETSFKKGLKAKRFKAALDTDYADKVLQLVFLNTRNIALLEPLNLVAQVKNICIIRGSSK
ncbi:ISAs1 family transposase [Colwellia polaris]|jgi:predicted transposase YbfD/YdcC|uniref:ISAs1 family transposase n=1 Tax=Colwellia polaris TaxID=326537 RepID=UPI001E5F319E|nr:ISAs1 family transposase [Colwellia polaris]